MRGTRSKPVDRVLVVGTTPDYVDLISRRLPGRCLFITDSALRGDAIEPCPDPADEVVCSLADETDSILATLTAHLGQWNLRLAGIVCFDCESMTLAAELADWLDFDYPSRRAIATARNKHAATERWRQAGLPCPQAELVHEVEEAIELQGRLAAPIVLKPLSGSGSELVFACHDEEDCRRAFEIMRSRLIYHHDARMYAPVRGAAGSLDPRQIFLAEELVEGLELSCDFVVEGQEARVIRACRKISRPGDPLGTVRAYATPLDLPGDVSLARLRRQLASAAAALGIWRAICMVDMVMRDGELVMLELAPRLAGDCLPALTRASTGLDVFAFALGFALGELPAIPSPGPDMWVAVRFLAATEGVVTRLDTTAIEADSRVTQVEILRGSGEQVVLPPASHDLRLLGYAIFQPQGGESIERQCAELEEALVVEIEPQARVETAPPGGGPLPATVRR
jgi:hypothetical protein